MKNLKKLTAVLCTLVMLLALCACGNTAAPAADPTETPAAEESSAPSDDVAADQTFVVGICQLVQHDALDAATEGFKQALTDKLGDKVTFQEGNASGDPATCSVIVNQFVSDDVDLIMANATPALLAAVAATNEIPILGTSVTDYGSALEISDWTGATGFNVSGTTDLAPLDGQAAVLKELCPDAKVVGILYCSGEPNSKFQADTITPMFEELGLEVKEFTFADSNDVANVTATACSECDVLYLPTDNTAASCTEAINNVALPAGVPIIAGEEGICRGCGIASLSISYFDLGYATGEMAYEVLVEGADPATMQIRFAPQFTKIYNPTNCEALNITVPEDYVALG